MTKIVDLHVHTNSSDSTFTPDEVIEIAQREGFAALGITDHDSVSSLPVIEDIGKEAGIEIVPGVELSAEKNGHEIHILGYYISWEEDWFRRKLAELSDAREKRAREIIRRLKGVGIDLDFEIVKEISGDAPIGRMHIARAMEKTGCVKNVQSAFHLYLGEGKPAYVRKFPLSPQEAIEIIKEVKGISSLAHPGLLKDGSLVLDVVKSGVDGIEVYHSEHTTAVSDSLLELAHKNRLLITGGSDCHGIAKKERLLGKVRLPYRYLDELKKRKGI